MGKYAVAVAKNLQKYLLLYSILAIALGLVLGYSGAVGETGPIESSITLLVFLIIYPMMINLDISKFGKLMKRPKPILLSLIYNFVITPIISLALVYFFIDDPMVALGFLLVMLIPGSSMSIGYTGLVEGSIEVATIALGVNFIAIPFILPAILPVLGASYHIDIPLGVLLQTILVVLILPMILGDLTRRFILRARGPEGFKRAKPYFGITTMVSMLLIVTFIFLLKAKLLIEKWNILAQLGIITFVYIIVMLSIITWLDRRAGLSYEEHMGIVFLSTGKNNGTAIAIAMLAFSPLVAIPAATLPLFQIIFLILYMNLSPRIRTYFGEKNRGDVDEKETGGRDKDGIGKKHDNKAA